MAQHFDYIPFITELQRDNLRETSLVRYLNNKCFDIRGVVLGIDLEDYVEGNGDRDKRFFITLDNIKTVLTKKGRLLIDNGIKAEEQHGVKIRTYRITTSPIPYTIKHFTNGSSVSEINEKFQSIALMLDGVAEKLTTYATQSYKERVKQSKVLQRLYPNGFEKDVYIAGFTSRVETGVDEINKIHIETLPNILNATKRIFASVNIADTRYPINSDIVALIASKILEMKSDAAKFSAVTNMPSNTPFYPASYHSAAEQAISLAMAGAGVITSVIKENNCQDYNTLERRVCEAQELMIKLSERIGKQIAEESKIPYLGLDLSQGSVFSQKENNSIAAAIEAVNGRKIGSVGTVSDFGFVLGALQKGAEAATALLVGYGGEFIPVSEDYVMALRMLEGTLTYETLLAMSGICAAGIDMLILDRYSPAEVIEGIIMDVATIATWNSKPLGTRLIVPDKKSRTNNMGFVVLGGLLGKGPEYSARYKLKDPNLTNKKRGPKPRPPGSIRK